MNFITTASIRGYIVLGIGVITLFIHQKIRKLTENSLYHPTELPSVVCRVIRNVKGTK